MKEKKLLMEKIMTMAEPFYLEVSTTAGAATEKTFTLDTDTYAGLAAALKDKTVLITGFKISYTAAAAASFCEYVKLDGKLLWSTATAVEAIDLSGVYGTTNVSGNAIKEAYGIVSFPLRNQIQLKNGAAEVGKSVVLRLYGIILPNRRY